jgi:hypothetical protein
MMQYYVCVLMDRAGISSDVPVGVMVGEDSRELLEICRQLEDSRRYPGMTGLGMREIPPNEQMEMLRMPQVNRGDFFPFPDVEEM